MSTMSTLSINEKMRFDNPMEGLAYLFYDILGYQSLHEDIDLKYLFISKKGNDFIKDYMSQTNTTLESMERYFKITKLFTKLSVFENGNHEYYFLIKANVKNLYSKTGVNISIGKNFMKYATVNI